MSGVAIRLDAPKIDAQSRLRLIRSSICMMDVQITSGSPQSTLRATKFRGVDLKMLKVIRVDAIGTREIFRTRGHMLADNSNDFYLSVQVSGCSSIYQAGVESICTPGMFRLQSTGFPYRGSIVGDGNNGEFSQLIAVIPGAVLRKLLPAIDATPVISGHVRSGSGNIMKALLELALEEGPALTQDRERKFGEMVVNGIAEAVQDLPAADAMRELNSCSALRKTEEKAKDFILRNLADPSLNVALVADYCGVSTRYLHAAFNDSQLKVGRYIREMRLQQCRSALRNPALNRRSITEIATLWGCDDPSTFARRYKTRFNKTPSQERLENTN